MTILLLMSIDMESLSGQVSSIQWMVDLTDEVLHESDLCERCTWVSPIITRITSAGNTFFFFRYSCSIDQGFSRMYTVTGDVVGECETDGDDVSCTGRDAYTVYTFAENITPVWTCDKGFECFFALEYEIIQDVPIAVDDSKCVEGIKILSVSEDYSTIQWNNQGVRSSDSKIEVDQSGTYRVTVTDDDGCVFMGEEAIEEISSLEVNIKGADRFCYQEESDISVTGFKSYQWSTGSIDSIITVNTGGEYFVTVVNHLECEGSGSFTIREDLPLSLEIVTDARDVIEGDTILISLTSDQEAAAPASFQWFAEGTLTCNQCPEASYIPRLKNSIRLIVEDEKGCVTEAIGSIPVSELALDIYIPNVIYSNSAIGNERFMIYGGRNVRMIERLAIFDRWGDKVFLKRRIKPNDKNSGWNGQSNGVVYAEDVYGFVADILFINGKRKSFSGAFSLIH